MSEAFERRYAEVLAEREKPPRWRRALAIFGMAMIGVGFGLTLAVLIQVLVIGVK